MGRLDGRVLVYLISRLGFLGDGYVVPFLPCFFELLTFSLDSSILHRFLHGGIRHGATAVGFLRLRLSKYHIIITFLPIAAEADGYQWLQQQHNSIIAVTA